MRLSNKILFVGISFLLTLAILACKHGPDDATLTSNVRTRLAADSTLPASSITVETKDGVVTLSGTVNSEAEKSRAEQIAKGVEGVKSVTNDLTVTPKATPTPVVISPDTKLKTDVTESLAKYGFTDINVEVANGEVTLTGNISRAKLQDAMKAAEEAHPKRVYNKMTIK